MRRTVTRAAAVVALLIFLAGCAVLASAVLDRPASTVRQEMVVSAPRVRIWRLLTNFERYERWNPYVVQARGDARIGNQLTFGTDDGDDFEPEVMDVKAQRKLRWRSRLLAPGILDEEQTFRIIPTGDGRFRLVYEGRIEGVLAPFSDTSSREQGYLRMLRALAREASRADT